jgi:hypothetical protein
MPRGGLSKMRVNFKGQTDTLEDVFGKSPIPVTSMTKTLWSIIKRKKLMKKVA